MHGYIDYSMNIPVFSYLMISLYICFYDGVEVEAWAKRVGARLARLRAIVAMPERMRLKPAAEAALDAADPFDLVIYEPGTSPSWEATSKGKPVNAFLASAGRSLGAWPIAVVPGLWKRLLNNSLETAPSVVPRPAPEKAKTKIRR
jgi:hypothetical protein